MYNVTFIADHWGESHLIVALESLGYKWKKNGRKVDAYGVDGEMLEAIATNSQTYWTW